MKAVAFLFLVAVAVGAVVLLAPEVEASGDCGHGTGGTGNWCQGWAHVSTPTGGVSSTRCFSVRLTNSAPSCPTTTANEAGWEMVAGACLTFYYFDTTTGAVPPAAPNKVTLLARFDSTMTNIKVFLNVAAEPANGTGYTLCATDTGDSGGSPRAGTYRIQLRVIKDNGIGGVGNYDVDTDGNAAVGSISKFDKGALRGQMLVSVMARNAYPAGSMYAFGTAGNEVVQIGATFTQPNGDANLESMRMTVADQATGLTYFEVGATVDVDGVNLVQSFTVDQTFPVAGNPYISSMQIMGLSGLTGQRWTSYPTTGHGATVTYLSAVFVLLNETFQIDPRIIADSDGAGTFATADDTDVSKLGSSAGPVTELFNRGETVYHEWYIFNARSELLSRGMTVRVDDASDAECHNYGTVTPTANKYSQTTALATGGACAAAGDTTGTAWHLDIANTDQFHTSDPVFYVSSLYFVDAHTQISASLSQDDFPTENANEDTTFTIQGDGMGGDDSDTIHHWCHVVTVRQDTDVDTSGGAVTWSIKDPTTATRAGGGTTDTGSDGWTPTSLDLLASTPLGTWTANCDVAYQGNTATYNQNIAVTVAGGNGTVLNQMGDPLKLFLSPLEVAPNGSVYLVASEAFLDGTARTGNAADTLVYVYDAQGTLVVNGAATTEIHDGIYAYTVAINGTPELGAWTAVVETTDPDTMDPVTTSNTFLVGNTTASLVAQSLQDHRDNSLEVFGMSFNTLEFDGFLFLLFWFGVLLLCLVRVRVFAGFVATLGLLETVIPTVMPGSFLGYFMLLALAMWLEAIAGESIYAKWLNKKNTDSDT